MVGFVCVVGGGWLISLLYFGGLWFVWLLVRYVQVGWFGRLVGWVVIIFGVLLRLGLCFCFFV